MSRLPAAKIAAIIYQKNFHVSAVLQDAIQRLRDQGVMVGGIVQEAEDGGSAPSRALQIVDIRSGETSRIIQHRGKEARGCKLDEGGVLALSHCVDRAIADRVDLVVIGRFGRAEAAGGGLLSSFGEAVCAGVPLLTAVREPHIERWQEFHGGLAIDLPPLPDAVVRWFGEQARGVHLLPLMQSEDSDRIPA